MATKNAKKSGPKNDKKKLKDLRPKKSVSGGGKTGTLSGGGKGDITDPANPGG
jgi:hypothetical protein